MTHISPDGPEPVDHGPVEERAAELGGFTVSFVHVKQSIDAAPLLRGLPDDRCQCPHWGLVTDGAMTVRYADHEETVSVGDVFYMPPGHVPSYQVGTRLIQFSPTAEAKAVDEAIARNLRGLQTT
jgi:hypothetical protein